LEVKSDIIVLGLKRGTYMPHDLDKAKEIIKQSGKAFHCRVLKYLKGKGWTVLISPYYNDNVSSKPREIDLIAEKAFDATSHVGEVVGTINVKLFIECKYISQKTVFRFHGKDKLKAEDLVTQTTPLRKDNSYTQKHHYLDRVDGVAKLFADESKSSPDNEIFYKAMNQSLNAMVYYRNKGSIIKLPPSRDGYIKKIVNYPVIVCNSFEDLYRVEIDNDAEPANITDNFLLEVNYAYMTSNGGDRNEYFLIDILNFDWIDRFLTKIEHDTELVSFFS
jgi:Holliday junction resolvase-like predicted endonuclease